MPRNASAHRGRHICLPFETESEKENAVLSFIHEGLARGKRCLFVGTRDEYEQLGLQLEEEGICSLRAESRGALIFRTPEEEYLDNGVFDPNVVLGRIDRLHQRGARRRLHRPVRDRRADGRPRPTTSGGRSSGTRRRSTSTSPASRFVGALPLSADDRPAAPGPGRPAHPPRRHRARRDLRQPVLRAAGAGALRRFAGPGRLAASPAAGPEPRAAAARGQDHLGRDRRGRAGDRARDARAPRSATEPGSPRAVRPTRRADRIGVAIRRKPGYGL